MGRAFEGLVIWLILELCCHGCCQRAKEESTRLTNELFFSKERSLLTATALQDEFIPWEEARTWRRFSSFGAYFVGGLTLFCWHLMQPAMYFLVLWNYYPKLEYLQQILGLLVGGREATYALLVLYKLYCVPSFLLVDMRATVSTQGWSWFLMYVLAPEKFVLSIRGENDTSSVVTISGICNRSKKMYVIFMFWIIGLDIVGVAALVVACRTDHVFAPMIVGYAVTSVSLLWTLLMGCCCCNENDGLGLVFSER